MKQQFPLFVAVAALVVISASATIRSIDKNYSPALAMRALNYCKASNCELPTIANWTCGPGCSATSTFTDVTVATNATAESLGFVGYNAVDNQIVYAIRGSRNFVNWIYDLDFTQIPYPNTNCKNDCRVHRGFFEVYSGLSNVMMTSLAALLGKYPNATLMVTGHSLGAAVAVLASVDIALSYPALPMTIYTFGCPRVGNAAFAAYASALFPDGLQHRLTHDKDPVPHLPPQSWSFLHTPSEVYFKSNTSSGYRLCDDSATAEDPTCSNSVLAIDPQDHIWYLGVCMGCCDPTGSDNCCKKLPLN